MSQTIPSQSHAFPQISAEGIASPAFVFSVPAIRSAISALREPLSSRGVRLLFAVKACSVAPVLEELGASVDGFAVSSAFEAEFAARYMGPGAQLHITSPGLTIRSMEELSRVTHVAFNSLSQCERFAHAARPPLSMGVRINPGCSTADDERYDPGRRYSKLGVPMRELKEWIPRGAALGIRGLHVHNACLCNSWVPLHDTVCQVAGTLGQEMMSMEWINLGGGFLWDEYTDFSPLLEAVDCLTETFRLQVYLEPGAGIINAAGYLVASVVDLFERDGMSIAVLDTSVNHVPEVFEYQFEPDVVEHVDGADHEYLLAGSSCLAGDIFGIYSFAAPLRVGCRLTFANVGAYSFVKSHMFNGINLPSIYLLDARGEVTLRKRFCFEDFASRCGG